MNNIKLNTPVAFLIFNRPETTLKVFEKIREAKPAKLLVVADGPRDENSEDETNCKKAREIINKVDWDCEVIKDFSDSNMGCKLRISSGLNWIFDNVEQAIILEDDCLPDSSFFRYCEELLTKYKNDERIMTISGTNYQNGIKRSDYSYYFSRYHHIWGWATWKRAWKHYDLEMKNFNEVLEQSKLKSIFEKDKVRKEWEDQLFLVYNGKISTWDYQWVYSCWLKNGLSIIPEVNLISNIGFGTAGTHTKGDDLRYANLPLREMDFPLKHPPEVIRNKEADDYTQETHYWLPFRSKVKKNIQKLLGIYY